MVRRTKVSKEIMQKILCASSAANLTEAESAIPDGTMVTFALLFSLTLQLALRKHLVQREVLTVCLGAKATDGAYHTDEMLGENDSKPTVKQARTYIFHPLRGDLPPLNSRQERHSWWLFGRRT